MRMPNVNVVPDVVGLSGGVDLISLPGQAPRGSIAMSSNYEAVFGGGYERVGGYERFDGRPRPSDATYLALAPSSTFTGVAVGDTVTGLVSGATGVCALVATGYLVITKATGTFQPQETLLVSGSPIGVWSGIEPDINGFADNEAMAAAADIYRADIAAVPGSGQIRGIAILGSTVYAWRDNVGATAMAIYKSTSSGWTLVALNEEVVFSNANTSVGEGDTLTKGGVTATIRRVAVESGTLASGVNTGRLIISGRSGGSFSAGAATSTGGGTLTLSGAESAITLTPGGRVVTDTYNFTASTDTLRLYGCDGVNREFEFDGAVWVPITTGMGSVRASFVKCHRNHLMFGFNGSLQHSGIGTPYIWSPIFGAAELGTGDTITGLVSVAGSESASALMVFCLNSVWTLYGNSSSDWKWSRLSEKAGAAAHSAQDFGLPMTHDTQGFVSYRPTQAYGNFSWDSVSRQVESLVKEKTPVASVVSKALTRYRCFFSDGTAISGQPVGKGFAWLPFKTTANVKIAVSDEVGGVTRTFYGDDAGFVYEADVGRSFDGEEIEAWMRLRELHQGSPLVMNQYRRMDVTGTGQSACTVNLSAEFIESDPDDGVVESGALSDYTQSGAAMFYGINDWGAASWGTGSFGTKRIDLVGQGCGLFVLAYSNSSTELPHTLGRLAIQHTPRRLAR